MAVSLNDKVVLITGASSGFGADAARLFARAGCLVVLTARRLERLNALAEEIRAAGGRAAVFPLDVTDRAQIERVVQSVLEQFGRIDILFNNAGLGRLDWFEALDPEQDIAPQIDVNLRGVIWMTRAVLPSMIQRRRGHIINMSSVAGRIAAPLYSVYAATKFGVRAFTDALRREVAPFGIHVSGIYPGGAATEFGLHAGDSVARRSLRLPAWVHMPSAYVARKVVALARRPRRAVIIPWWMIPLLWLEALFPALVDWAVCVFFVRRFHKPDDKP
jgi:NADP-dependent 3-hydroxy acid dehydrogenase YdfG